MPHGFEWLWIALIVLLLFGPTKLPGLARSLGKSLGEFKKAKDEFEKEIHSAAVSEDTKTLTQQRTEDRPEVKAAEGSDPAKTAAEVNPIPPHGSVPLENGLTKKI